MKIKDSKLVATIYNSTFEVSELVEVSCNLCGNTDGEIMYNEQEFHIKKCRDCGLVYVTPQPTRNSLEKYYRNFYGGGAAETSASWIRKQSFDQIKKIIESYGYNSGNLLDVGCGFGHFLQTMNSPGWVLTGIDQDADATKFVNESNISIINGDFLDYNFDTSYDVIICLGSLEHMSDPMAVLRKAHTLLNNNGIMVIKVPYVEIFFKLKKIIDLGVHMSAPRHLFDFSPRTLSLYLDKTGFYDIQIYVGAREQGGSLLNIQKINMVKFISKLLYYASFRNYIFPFCGSIVSVARKGV
jgi:SAM-dependent methyltransferase